MLPDHSELLVTQVCKPDREKSFPGTNKWSNLPWVMYHRDRKPAHSKCKSPKFIRNLVPEHSLTRSPELSLHLPAVIMREAIVQLVLQSSMWLCSQSSMQLCNILCQAKGTL